MYSTALSTGAGGYGLACCLRAREGGKKRTAVDGVRVLVRDLDAELLLDGHDHLDGVEAVEAEVVGEVCCRGDLCGVLDLLTERLSAIGGYLRYCRSSCAQVPNSKA